MPLFEIELNRVADDIGASALTIRLHTAAPTDGSPTNGRITAGGGLYPTGVSPGGHGHHGRRVWRYRERCRDRLRRGGRRRGHRDSLERVPGRGSGRVRDAAEHRDRERRLVLHQRQLAADQRQHLLVRVPMTPCSPMHEARVADSRLVVVHDAMFCVSGKEV